MAHLTCHQITFPISLGGLGLPSMVQFTALAFLGCWALIVPTLIFHFQQDDHFAFLDVMAHVKTSTYPFQIALWDTHAILLEVIRSRLAFQKSNGAILSSNGVFFYGPTR